MPLAGTLPRCTNAVRPEFAPDDEADLEGMAVADGFLWVVGSHGFKRKTAKPDRDRNHADNAMRLAKVRFGAICDLPPALSDGKPSWLLLYDPPGPDRKEGERTVFGDLLRHD